MAAPAGPPRFSAARIQARLLDVEDKLSHVKEEFNVPTKADVKRKTLPPGGEIVCILLLPQEALPRVIA
jgi:hypothetical protein